MKISVLQEKILRHLAEAPPTHVQALGVWLGAPLEFIHISLYRLHTTGLVAITTPQAETRPSWRRRDWRPIPAHWTITPQGLERLRRLDEAA